MCHEALPPAAGRSHLMPRISTPCPCTPACQTPQPPALDACRTQSPFSTQSLSFWASWLSCTPSPPSICTVTPPGGQVGPGHGRGYSAWVEGRRMRTHGRGCTSMQAPKVTGKTHMVISWRPQTELCCDPPLLPVLQSQARAAPVRPAHPDCSWWRR
jgi:hypothetical protein